MKNDYRELVSDARTYAKENISSASIADVIKAFLEDWFIKGYLHGYNDAQKAYTYDLIPEVAKSQPNSKVVLYGLQNINSGEIVFSARGGAYQDIDAAMRKQKALGKDYRIVTYLLSEPVKQTEKQNRNKDNYFNDSSFCF